MELLENKPGEATSPLQTTEGFAQRVHKTQRLVAYLNWILDQSEELEKTQIPQLEETQKDLDHLNEHYKEMVEGLLNQQKANDKEQKELSIALDAKVAQLQQEREARLAEVNSKLWKLRGESAVKESELASAHRRLQALETMMGRAHNPPHSMIGSMVLPPAIEQKLISSFADDTTTAASQFMLHSAEQMTQFLQTLGPPGTKVPLQLPSVLASRELALLAPTGEGEAGSPAVLLALPAPKVPQYPF
eukprot:GGOE01061213.1.p1 GENE.GGOE01061213.1~~GGOE01061213.1.p1  ORF type:complete len:247 (+),score=52.42 GGOE01061213.1:53-793(+)